MKSSLVLGIVAASLLAHGPALAQQTKGQQKCINAMNKGMAKIAAAQLKAAVKCTSGFAKGKNMDAQACYSDDAKVDDAGAKNCQAETKLCTSPLPTFAYTPCGNVNFIAETRPEDLPRDIFGFTVNPGITSCASDKAGCKCQGKTFKAATKLFSTHLKTFNKCKKDALKAGATTDDPIEACVSSDPKSKIAKAGTKLSEAVDKGCVGVADPFPGGSCGALTGSGLATCIGRWVRCRACETEVFADNLFFDCDLFDDFLNNGTCSSPD